MEKIMPVRAKLISMNAPLRKPWTQDQFFAWASTQEGRYEFDGFEPVAMTGGTANHSVIMRSLHRALDRRLQGSACQYLGPDAGLATVESRVRYPDALVTCSRFPGNVRTIPGVVIAFEIVSPGTSRVDRIDKVREYAAVPSIRRYVILESTTAALTVFERQDAETPWIAATLTGDDVLRMPELAIEIPVSEFYVDTDFSSDSEASDTITR
jgi:Uma2 family endonuclease